jgi:predicted nucleic acid-binding protein
VSRFLIDTNVLLNIATADATWFDGSRQQLTDCSARGTVCVNPIIFAELAPAFASKEALDEWLADAVYERLALPYGAAWRE